MLFVKATITITSIHHHNVIKNIFLYLLKNYNKSILSFFLFIDIREQIKKSITESSNFAFAQLKHLLISYLFFGQKHYN